jgi:hypothetical protein
MTASGQGLFRSREFVTSGQKGPTRADMALLPVAHAQNILPVPVTDVTSGHVTNDTSVHVTSGSSTHRSTANMTWAVPIYYVCPIIAILSFNSRVLLVWVVICLYCILWFTVDCLSGLCVLFFYLLFLFFHCFPDCKVLSLSTLSKQI